MQVFPQNFADFFKVLNQRFSSLYNNVRETGVMKGEMWER